MTQKKSTGSRKTAAVEVQQVNPVSRRIQTEEGWKRSQVKMKHSKSKG